MTTADTSGLRAQLATRAETPQQKDVRQLIERMRPELAKVLPETITPERLTRTALTEMRRVPALYDCSPESLLGALMLSAQLGLEPGPLGHVYLVPFKREVTWILGYRGIVELAYRSGRVKRIDTGIVREGDTFTHRKGSRAVLDHIEAGPPGERSWTAVWALAELTTGGRVFEVLWPEQVEARRSRSPAARKESGPWMTDTAAMWRKSAVRALAPMLPQSAVFASAVERDDTAAVLADVLDVTDATETEGDEPGGES